MDMVWNGEQVREITQLAIRTGNELIHCRHSLMRCLTELSCSHTRSNSVIKNQADILYKLYDSIRDNEAEMMRFAISMKSIEELMDMCEQRNVMLFASGEKSQTTFAGQPAIHNSHVYPLPIPTRQLVVIPTFSWMSECVFAPAREKEGAKNVD